MSLLIKGVQVVDGTGKPPYKADVLVQKNIISAISPPAGGLKRRRAEKEIDGLGNYLTPGFIDIHTTSDHYLTLFTDHQENDFVSQGVTTVIAGHCGASLAPLLYGSLGSIRKWADPAEININWHTVAELLRSLRKLPLYVNFGTLAGHSTIRRALIGEEERHLTVRELTVFENILKRAIKDGAFGFSTGLGYVHARSATPKEVKTLVKTTADLGGVYTTHLRGAPHELLDAVKETIRVARDTGTKTVISHLAPIKSYGDQFHKVLELLEKNAHKASVYFDVSPHPRRTQALYTFLPQSLQRLNLEAMSAAIRDKRTTNLIKKEWQKMDFTGIQVISAPRHPYLTGKMIQDADDLLNLMLATNLRATMSNPDIDEELLKTSLSSSRVFIGSDAASPEDTFLKYLEIAVKDNGIPIEQAIKKTTSEPASYFNLKKRGVVKERHMADLVILGKSDYRVKNAILGGKIVGQEEIKGEVLEYQR